MFQQQSLAGFLAWLVLCVTCVLPTSAQLPSLDEPPWLGYFAAYDNNRYQLGVTSNGAILLDILNHKGSPLSKDLQIPIIIAIQETTADGKVTTKNIRPKSLISTDQPSEKLEKITIKGQITGNTAFEIVVEQLRGTILIGGHLTSSVAAKNPTQFHLQVKIPKLYSNVSKLEKKTLKILEKEIARDRISLSYTDGKRKKWKTDEKVKLTDNEFIGSGISGIEMDFNAYKGRKIEFTTSPNAAIRLTDSKSGLLKDGFSIMWTPDITKDADCKARLMIGVK